MKKKDIIELSITGTLIIVLLFTVINAMRRRRQAKPPEIKPQDTILQQEPLQDKELFSRLEQETKDLELRRDPFTSSLITPVESSSFRLYLTGILWDEKNPTAIINGKIIGIGDKVGGNSVVDIKKDRVILNDGFSDFELRLK